MEKRIWHRHLGVYGICRREGKLLVTFKSGGPYTGRYDLPGGTIEPGETIEEALHREFLEETGIKINVASQVGTRDFVVPWTREGYAHTHVHHIAVLYETVYVSGDVADSPQVDDSVGAGWLAFDQLNRDNSSPLAMQAVEWLRNRSIPVQAERYEVWNLLTPFN